MDLIDKFKEKEAKRFKLKVGVFALLMDKEKVLLLRRFQTGTEDGLYVLPMGGHDGTEPLTQSLIREIKEEINLDVQPENVTLTHVMHRFHPMDHGLSFEQLDMIYFIHSYHGTLHNNEPDKCDDLAFFPMDQLPENTAPFVKKMLQCIQKGQLYSEFGWKS